MSRCPADAVIYHVWDFNISGTFRRERIAGKGGHFGWLSAVIYLSMPWAGWGVGICVEPEFVYEHTSAAPRCVGYPS